MSYFRKIFWATGVVLYVTPIIMNFFYLPTIVFSIMFFFIYVLMLTIYFFSEEIDHYRHIAVTLTIVSMFIYPLLYIASNNAGIQIEFKMKEEALNEFVKKVSGIENIEELEISQFEDMNKLNGENIKEDEYIFENFGVKPESYENVKSEMNRLGLNMVVKEKNAIFIKMGNFPSLVYYHDPSNKNTVKQNREYNIKLNENWYAHDF